MRGRGRDAIFLLLSSPHFQLISPDTHEKEGGGGEEDTHQNLQLHGCFAQPILQIMQLQRLLLRCLLSRGGANCADEQKQKRKLIDTLDNTFPPVPSPVLSLSLSICLSFTFFVFLSFFSQARTHIHIASSTEADNTKTYVLFEP